MANTLETTDEKTSKIRWDLSILYADIADPRLDSDMASLESMAAHFSAAYKGKLAERLKKESGGDLKIAVDLGYKLTLGRPPSPPERDRALTYVENDPARLKGFAWLLFNMDEFIYVR